jgi:hypothetical protein
VSGQGSHEGPEPVLDPEVERELGEALGNAWSPAELDAETNERLLALALEDPLAPASAEEVAGAESLRDALEAPDGSPDEHGLAAALRHAYAPEPLSAGGELALRSHAVERAGRRGRLFVLTGAGTALVAAAAAWAVLVSPAAEFASQPPAHFSRSSVNLFDHKFEPGRNTERVDRIAQARLRELRDNRFRRWGVP